jgi:hypothetical protein
MSLINIISGVGRLKGRVFYTSISIIRGMKKIYGYYWHKFKLWVKSEFFRKLRKDKQFWAKEWVPKKGETLQITKRELSRRKQLLILSKKGKKYLWASIIRAENHGNYLIEYCLKRILQLPKPDLVVNVLKNEFPHNIDDYQFIINPGTTTLYQDPKIDIAFQKFVPEKTPIICFGASVWYSDRRSKFKDENELVRVAKKMQYPIGCRDPFTYDLLQHNNIKSDFIGCPTLFCQGDTVLGDYIAFSFGRNNMPEQAKLLRHLSEIQNVKVLIHEAQEEKYCQNLKVETIKDLRQFLRVYYGAKCVITGRLHGALPGISANKPVFYFQTVTEFDSRLTLLSYLGLPIQTINEMYNINTSTIQYDFNKVTYLKEAFSNYVKKFKKEWL